MRVMNEGILGFDDAYFLANRYLFRIPKAKKLIQDRFGLIFVDEMQDMGKHQYDLLENIFFDSGGSPCKYQRIGDRNQAIHNNHDFDVLDVWKDRTQVLKLSTSCRLSAPVARVVRPFAVHSSSEFTINGSGDSNIKPHLIVYDDKSIQTVIATFSSILRGQITNGAIPSAEKSIFKAIAWNSE